MKKSLLFSLFFITIFVVATPGFIRAMEREKLDLEQQECLDKELENAVFVGRSWNEVDGLLKRGANPNYFSKKHCDALSYFFGNVHSPRLTNILYACLDAGLDLNLKDRYGETVLHLVSIRNRVQAAGLLLRLDADPNAQDLEGYTPLHYADSKEMVEVLLAHGADPEIKTDSGKTPLEFIGSGEAADVLKAWIERRKNS